MDNSYNNFCNNSVLFIKGFFKTYFDDHNLTFLLPMLDDDITWFGPCAHSICKNYQDTVKLLNEQEKTWNAKYTIINENYETNTINQEFCIVFGEICAKKYAENTPDININFRFSMTCRKYPHKITLFNCCITAINETCAENHQINAPSIEYSNNELEAKLAETTEILSNKTMEFESLIRSMGGALETRKYDEDCTITYVDDSFLKLTGYSKEDINDSLKNKHTSLLFDDKIQLFKDEIKRQLNINNYYATEYRIKTKSGKDIWILDKGTTVTQDDGIYIHCLLTDITADKETEKAIIISQKRYEIIAGYSNILPFEYDPTTKKILFHREIMKEFNFPEDMEPTVDVVIKLGIIHPYSVNDYKELFEKMDAGVPFAQTAIYVRDINNETRVFEIMLTNIFDDTGKPIQSIGVKRDITKSTSLEKDHAFGNTLASNRRLIFEANVSRDMIVEYNKEWAKEIALTEIHCFTKLLKQICENTVDPKYWDLFYKHMSATNIINAYNNNQRLFTFEYCRNLNKRQFLWYEFTMNIIKNSDTNEFHIRCYINNINESKEAKIKFLEENNIYRNIISKATTVYEINLTRDIILSGYEYWVDILKVEPKNSFSDLIYKLAEKAVHPEDIDDFNQILLPENLLKAFKNGENEIFGEYRRLNKKGETIWVKSNIHLYEDRSTKDIKCFAYINDIDKIKKEQLALLYKAEHDLLTNYYNKITTEKKIDEFITSNKLRDAKHALLMIDIDNFKLINDNFGHAFGDAALSKISKAIMKQFRDDDILGRIGGDEFVVLMKNITNTEMVMKKAKEICTIIPDIFSQNEVAYNISLSVGIAIFDEDGKNYNELYRHSDTALYEAKKNGKNTCYLYCEKMGLMNASKMN